MGQHSSNRLLDEMVKDITHAVAEIRQVALEIWKLGPRLYMAETDDPFFLLRVHEDGRQRESRPQSKRNENRPEMDTPQISVAIPSRGA
jgi:hypothetical protein